ncbi:hypothetical protein SAMN05421510_100138 [Nitrosomonas ureae]|uniref:Uncharacterized protein n=1 Tax=Nitrosomonas ureae TaxID=44577 RepID=A0A1H8ZGR0_9PROT|nr:hypothetical protein C8R28_10101 [Nitrosomonas ureae]PXX12653.1 hypothetical protein C8R27_12338 [Nitrosomonas ureae]SDT87212.1 hypothetical protein SAMN05216406_1076 [Nitrosomonas ureae]SEP63602.1 hypothetical protein SAMN05421510_100138 [Nitrosomonas ureae]
MSTQIFHYHKTDRVNVPVMYYILIYGQIIAGLILWSV